MGREETRLYDLFTTLTVRLAFLLLHTGIMLQ